MAYTLGDKCAKNLFKRTVLLHLIIKNVVTCFFGTQCRRSLTERFLSLPPGCGTVCHQQSLLRSTLHSFRRARKTHLFTASFPPS